MVLQDPLQLEYLRHPRPHLLTLSDHYRLSFLITKWQMADQAANLPLENRVCSGRPRLDFSQILADLFLSREDIVASL